MSPTPTNVHVPRDRLLRALPHAPAVLLVCAPAGWGKTYFLDDWCARPGGAAVRVHMSTRHADAETFLETLARALSHARVCDWTPPIEPDGRPADARLRALLERVPAETSIVLDDVHEIPDDGPAARLVETLLAAARRGTLRLVIATRTAPPCVRARDFVHGTAVRVGTAELAMDAAEVRAFFRETALADDDAFLTRAAARTEGWPAGLRALRHRALEQGATASLARATTARDDLAAYFDEEIVAPLPALVRDTLSDVALLDRIDRDACDALGAGTAFAHLLALARDGLFVAESSDGLRLHPMLRDHLAHRLRATDPARAAERLDRIAHWHERSGRTLEAIEASTQACALAEDDIEIAARAAARLEAGAAALIEAGRRDRFLSAGARMPRAALAGRPYLARLLHWANAELDAPRVVIPADAPRAREARCMDCLIEASRALREGRIADVASAALAARDHVPQGDAFLRNCVVAVLQAAFRFGGDPAVGEAAVDEAARIAEDVRRPAAAVQAGAMLGILQIMHGRLFAAEEALRRALAIADARLDPGAPARGLAHQFLGYVLHAWDRLDEAAAELERARAIAEPIAHAGILTGTLRVLATVRHQQGDEAAAQHALSALVAFMDRPDTSSRNREWLDGVRAAHAITTGESAGLGAWLARRGYVPAEIAALPAPHLHARLQEYTTLGQALLLLQRFDEAAALGEALSRVAAAAGRIGFFVITASVRASACEALGMRADADRALADALRRAAPEHMVRAVADTPGPLAAVVARARPNGVPLAFLENVRRRTERDASPAGLTERERAVLILLAGGHSNKGLARTLGISVSTVKTHLHHAFRKLGARSRTHALARARDLGLLGHAPDPAAWDAGGEGSTSTS